MYEQFEYNRLPYRLLMLYIDPILIFAGAVLQHFAPSFYLAHMSPHSTPSTYDPASQIVFDQLAASYVLFAWIEAVVLRSTNNLKVWKTVLLGILICDVLHLYGTWLTMGSLFWDLGAWTGFNWINIGTLALFGATRMAFLIGVGLDEKGMAEQAKIGL
ncbi:hypothetical protein MMC30_004595 [Trapelia coarctata]|nr:hypothetical protein [Trapelia coarctata]